MIALIISIASLILATYNAARLHDLECWYEQRVRGRCVGKVEP